MFPGKAISMHMSWKQLSWPKIMLSHLQPPNVKIHFKTHYVVSIKNIYSIYNSFVSKEIKKYHKNT